MSCSSIVMRAVEPKNLLSVCNVAWYALREPKQNWPQHYDGFVRIQNLDFPALQLTEQMYPILKPRCLRQDDKRSLVAFIIS